MTIKTREQIATAIASELRQSRAISNGTLVFVLSGLSMKTREIIGVAAEIAAKRAIEADRAQRSDRLARVTVHSAELGDPSLRCDDCGEALCTVEESDSVVTLADVALTHGDTVCIPRAMCDNCDERIEPDDIHAGDGVCGSCNHNAARSGA